ncbi:hypothetical protein ACWN8B_05730 [Vagococcus zengguangii]|uniref:Uncharacterized protein n=1 Tax=Vagococcus zengguangii TaxID=2571750 RepID=A0A4D7CS14_9ENTE|nr:hypothetical protein [Vagococcus zengguangii]QCI86898.1 hypothetical protein FA707_07920 [Vagococcus zengguangii]
MDKNELLNYLLNQQKRTKVATKLEKTLRNQKNVEADMKKKWNGTIYASIIVATLLRIMYYPYNNYMMFTTFLYVLGIGLFLLRRNKVQVCANKVSETEQLLKNEMSKPEYLEGLHNFPVKFYDFDSTYRLYNLVSESRANTLQEAFNLLELQLNAEYQNHLAEQNLKASEAAERNTRVSAITSVITAYNTSKKK